MGRSGCCDALLELLQIEFQYVSDFPQISDCQWQTIPPATMATGFDLGYSDQVYFYPTTKTTSPQKGSPHSPPLMPETSYPTPRNSFEAGNSIKTPSRSYQPPVISIPKHPVLESPPSVTKLPISPDSPPVVAEAEANILSCVAAFASDLDQQSPSHSFHGVSLHLYDLISENLEHNRVHHSFDVKSGKLTIYCGAGAMHETIAAPFTAALYDLSRQLIKINSRLRFKSTGAAVRSLFKDGELVGKKAPDVSFSMVSAEHDSGIIVVEIGVSETREQLLQDAREWLWWTNGRIRLVIIVDIVKPKLEEDQKNPGAWEGYYEVYARLVVCAALSPSSYFIDALYRTNFTDTPASVAKFQDNINGEERIFCVSKGKNFLPCEAQNDESKANDQEFQPISLKIPLSYFLTPKQISLAAVPPSQTVHMTVSHQELIECGRAGVLEEFKEKEITSGLKRKQEVDGDPRDATYLPGEAESRSKRKVYRK